MINSTEWDDAVQSKSLPLINSGNERIDMNNSKIELYVGNVKKGELNSNGDILITGEVKALQTFP